MKVHKIRFLNHLNIQSNEYDPAEFDTLLTKNSASLESLELNGVLYRYHHLFDIQMTKMMKLKSFEVKKGFYNISRIFYYFSNFLDKLVPTIWIILATISHFELSITVKILKSNFEK